MKVRLVGKSRTRVGLTAHDRDDIRSIVECHVRLCFGRLVRTVRPHLLRANKAEFAYALVTSAGDASEEWEMLLFREGDGWSVANDGFNRDGTAPNPVGRMSLAALVGR